MIVFYSVVKAVSMKFLNNYRIFSNSALFFLIFMPALLFADTVFLRSGVRLEGTIVGQTRTEIRIQTANGIQVLQKTNIQRVVYLSPEEKQKQEEAVRRQEEEYRRQEAERIRTAEAERIRIADEARRQQEIQKAEQARKEEEARKAEALKKEQDKRNQPPAAISNATFGGVMWRSALLPGWGQWYAGNRWTGIFTGVLFAGAIGYADQERRQALSDRNAYDSDVARNKYLMLMNIDRIGLVFFLDSVSQTQYARRSADYNKSLNAVAFVYVAQLVHAFFTGRTLAAPAPAATSDIHFSFDAIPVRAGDGLQHYSGNQDTSIDYRLRADFIF